MRTQTGSSVRYFFTSDSHFGHANIIKYCHRPFLAELDKRELAKRGAWHDGVWKGSTASTWRITPEAVAMMDDHLIEQINATVGENDVLWHLGDFSMEPKDKGKLAAYYNRCRTYRDRIKCRTVNLVLGNHDAQDDFGNSILSHIFSTTCSLARIQVPGSKNRLVLSHYAFAVWDKSHRGAINLYGHSHTTAEAWLERVMPGRRALDVGVDNAAKLLGEYRPFSLDEILGIVGRRPGFSCDHHVSALANTPEEHELN